MSHRRQRQRWLEYLLPGLGLVAIVAVIAFVYVSYTANSGLPFSATYNLSARLPDAERLIKTDEVRIGGVRVGQVSSVTARLGSGGRPYSVIGLALSPSVGALPIDTRIEVQSSSVLGQTYVDLIPGHSATRVRSGGTMPISDARPVVQLTDLFDIFNHATARSIQSTIGEFGYGLAGRAPELNELLAELPPLLVPFTTVAETLAARATDLTGLLHGWESLAGALAPVTGQLSGLVSGAATTVSALASERRGLAQTIIDLPSSESAATTALGDLHRPLSTLAALIERLRAAGPLLPVTLARVNATLSAGQRPLRQLPTFSPVLGGALAELQALSREPTTAASLRQLTATLNALRPLLVSLTPAQVDCNIIGLYGRNFSSAWGTLGSGIGPSYVVAGVVTPGATGEVLQSAKPAANLHINYLSHEDPQECESGNEPYSATQQDLSNPPGNQSRSVPSTTPPAGVAALAQRAGLLTPPSPTAR
ncbi:MAG TPA: MlaD family protein [Solirubrobacteraceae bacterium]|nr:MlaD family protein [Solirubrobacteraceae bacterium]